MANFVQFPSVHLSKISQLKFLRPRKERIKQVDSLRFVILFFLSLGLVRTGCGNYYENHIEPYTTQENQEKILDLHKQ